jgi:hypothetical protein
MISGYTNASVLPPALLSLRREVIVVMPGHCSVVCWSTLTFTLPQGDGDG